MKKEEIKWLEDCLADNSVKIQDLEHQLAEKDKEIEKMKLQLEGECKAHIMFYEGMEERIRHQVCEEIRENLKKYSVKHLANYIIEIEETRLDLLIDQIEKGEIK